MRLYLDASAIIYSVEGQPSVKAAVQDLVAEARRTPNSMLVTSRLSFLEVTVKPYREGEQATLDRYAEALGILTLLEVTDAVIEQARNIRAAHGFRVPDALHLATALVDGADVFVTGDKDLRRFEGVPVRVIHDR